MGWTLLSVGAKWGKPNAKHQMGQLTEIAFQSRTHWSEWSEAAARAVHSDPFCSSPYWCIPLVKAFAPGGELTYYKSGSAVAVMNESEVKGGRLCLPGDCMWLLGCPILGEQLPDFFRELLAHWGREGCLRQVTVSGLYPSHPLLGSAPWRLYSHWELESSGRNIASLEGGMDGFLSRRSKNFRSRLRRTVKKAEKQELICEYMPESASPGTVQMLLDRVMEVEKASWKGLAGQGINGGSMERFYRFMLPLLGRDGRLRGLFLQRDGKDVAYLFGAFFANYFRGLQFSYRDDEELGLGNVCQYRMIERLLEQDCQRYDLGQAMAYKKRWAETHIESYSFTLQVPR